MKRFRLFRCFAVFSAALLLAVTFLSWVYSLVRKISAIMERRRHEKAKEEILIQRVREAGRNSGGIVHIDDLQD